MPQEELCQKRLLSVDDSHSLVLDENGWTEVHWEMGWTFMFSLMEMITKKL